MAAFRTYGIPLIIESREIFLYNGGAGRLPIRFTGGIPDPKYLIPATYTTDSEFEQMVIELSPQFNTKVFRFGPDGRKIEGPSTFNVKIANSAEKAAEAAPKKAGRPRIVEPVVDDTKVYKNVETLGEATEILLDLGAKADELNGPAGVMAAMLRMKVSFPNLKIE